jgi:hypothetical protein
MLTVRVSPADDARDRLAVAQAIEQHPLAGVLTATIAIGVNGPSPWRADDPAPRVAVVTGRGLLGRVQRAHLTAADAIVVTDAATARVAHAAAPDALLAVVADTARPFLQGCTTSEAATAWDEVAHHPELARSLGAPDDTDTAHRIAEHAVELVIALGN